uniref:Ras association domain family member 5 n=1 Tax=Latimeria chalumnae TaxID=7897 RepID=H3AMA7_LATCH
IFQNATKENHKALSLEEIRKKIEEYNESVTNCLGMKLNDDGTFTGFIKVHLKLRRPVTVASDSRPTSIYDGKGEVNPADIPEERTSFYLPLDAVKQIHVSSINTVSEVIFWLLKKFMVVDNPKKFALFTEAKKDGRVLIRKLPEAEYPLYLRLLAGPDTEALSFVLKENEMNDVEWDAFSLPELQNFLIMMEKEEKDKIQQVEKKYAKFRQQMEQALKEAREKPG